MTIQLSIYPAAVLTCHARTESWGRDIYHDSEIIGGQDLVSTLSHALARNGAPFPINVERMILMTGCPTGKDSQLK